MVVAMWLCLLGLPALLTAIYLAWVGKWFILALIVAAVILGKVLCLCNNRHIKIVLRVLHVNFNHARLGLYTVLYFFFF